MTFNSSFEVRQNGGRDQALPLQDVNRKKSKHALSSTSKCVLGVFTVGAMVGGAAGAVFLILGATSIFGPVGSIGFIASIAGGGTVVLIASGGVVFSVALQCKCAAPARGDVRADEDEEVSLDIKRIQTEAVDFALDKLKEYPTISHTILTTERNPCLHQPANPQIGQLMNLYQHVYLVNFEKAMMEHEDPWSQPSVQEAADALMKISYAVGHLTLKELSLFDSRLQEGGEWHDFMNSSTTNNYYPHQTYFPCSQTYHRLRGGVVWKQQSNNQYDGQLRFPKRTPKAHANLFYQKETLQSQWRALYNSYCDDVTVKIPNGVLDNADRRYRAWIQPDNKKRNFTGYPDSLFY